MKKNSIIPICMIAFLMTFCSKKSNRFDIRSDKELISLYTENEIQELEDIINYTDKIVLKHTNETDIESAYHQYFEKQLQHVKDTYEFWVPVKDSTRYGFLENIDTDVFNSVWHFNNAYDKVQYKDSLLTDVPIKSLELNPTGRYLEYLKMVGEKDTVYSEIYNSMNLAAGISASLARGFIQNHNKLDFSVAKNRLFASIYILTIGETTESKLENYMRTAAEVSTMR